MVWGGLLLATVGFADLTVPRENGLNRIQQACAGIHTNEQQRYSRNLIPGGLGFYGGGLMFSILSSGLLYKEVKGYKK